MSSALRSLFLNYHTENDIHSFARGYEMHRCEQAGVHGFIDKLRDPASAVIEAIRAVGLPCASSGEAGSKVDPKQGRSRIRMNRTIPKRLSQSGSGPNPNYQISFSGGPAIVSNPATAYAGSYRVISAKRFSP